MTLAILESCALSGLDAPAVRVEVHLAPGLPAFHVVGLPDAEVRESRERVRAAIANSGFGFPAGRLTVNLAPADLPKESGRYDLPIAIGVLLASGQIALPHRRRGGDAADPLARLVLAGELSLTGHLVAIGGALALALAVARRRPGATLMLPAANAAEAARVPGLPVLAALDLASVAAHLEGREDLPRARPAPDDAVPAAPCMSDVRGQPAARRALEVAAAGAHSLLLSGSPGTGKSMLAQRLPGLLPPLAGDEWLEAGALAGLAPDGRGALGQRPFRAPHHSATAVALAGGGARPRPGELSLAHLGVLFLDELPEFSRAALETLREPMETGRIALARATYRVTYPARFQFVAAMNPCRCGWHGHPRRPCTCSPDQVAAYRARVSGPLLDRIDLHQPVPPPEPDWMDAPPGEDSTAVALRVAHARQRQLARQGCLNAFLGTANDSPHCVLAPEARGLWKHAAQHLDWSARAAQRALRVARTIADLAAADTIDAAHIAEAVQYRRQTGPAR